MGTHLYFTCIRTYGSSKFCVTRSRWTDKQYAGSGRREIRTKYRWYFEWVCGRDACFDADPPAGTAKNEDGYRKADGACTGILSEIRDHNGSGRSVEWSGSTKTDTVCIVRKIAARCRCLHFGKRI